MGSRRRLPIYCRKNEFSYFVTASAWGTVATVMLCAVDRVASDLIGSTETVLAPTLPTSKKFPLGSIKSWLGLVPAVAVGVVNEVKSPFDPIEKRDTFAEP